MSNAAYNHLIASGALLAPDADGRWDRETVLRRMDAYRSLVDRTRSVPRRVILLNLEADEPVPLTARRVALEALLSAMRPLSRKMVEVREELRQARTAGPPPARRRRLRMRWPEGRSRDAWLELLRTTPDLVLDREWRTAAMVARRLTHLVTVGDVPQAQALPAEERFVLVLIRQLMVASASAT